MIEFFFDLALSGGFGLSGLSGPQLIVFCSEERECDFSVIPADLVCFDAWPRRLRLLLTHKKSKKHWKQRRHLRTIGSFEVIEATIDSGAACCVFPRDVCNDVPIRQCAESRRARMFRTSSGQKVAHEGIWTIECSTECGFTRRLTGAVTSVQKILCLDSHRKVMKCNSPGQEVAW